MAVEQHIRLLAVRYGAPEHPMVIDYPIEAFIPVSDDKPHVDLLCTEQCPLPSDSKRWKNAVTPLNEFAGVGSWYRFSLESAFESAPALTTLQVKLKVPKDTTLNFYLIPTKVFSVADLQAMLEDIRNELKFDAAWEPGARHTVGFAETRSYGIETEESLVKKAKRELQAAALVRQSPYSELNLRTPLPENAIVSHWALKRVGDLRRLIAGANSSGRIQRLRAAQSPNDARRTDAERDASRYEGLAGEASHLLNRVARHIDPAELNTPFPYGPAAHRDYRLRWLLGAFADPLIEIPVALPTLAATYPPTRYGNIYELWCAVAMVQRIRLAGITARLAHAAHGLHARSYQWVCSSDHVTITIDFEPSTVPLTFDSLPAARWRSVPAWSIEAGARVEPDQFFSTSSKCTPDYLIRLETAGAAVILIGDASATIPDGVQKQDLGDRKTAKVAGYVNSMGWKRADHAIIRPSPMGGFALHPGPQASWDELPLNPCAPDVSVFGFHPGETGRAGADAWYEYLMRQVDQSGVKEKVA